MLKEIRCLCLIVNIQRVNGFVGSGNSGGRGSLLMSERRSWQTLGSLSFFGRGSYPRKDEHGRLLTESSCLPFILTSMGGLCEEGHEFLRVCRKRNPEKTKHLIDVLVTQHSRWVASRMRRSLFGQATSTAVESCDHKQQHFSSQCARTTGVRAQPVKSSSRNTAGSMRRLKAAFSNSIETPKVGSQIGQDGEIFPSSPS